MTVAALLRAIPKRKFEDAVWLLTAELGVNRSALLLEPARELDEKFLRGWKKKWNRRLGGEPLQYVHGRAPFYGREFLVNESVLVPRPETESLVELSLALMKGRVGAKALDIGTGSGAIALTLKLERPDWKLTATDISSAALAVAKKNGKSFGADVKFRKGDLFAPGLRKEPWDLVVSNPPYLDFSRDAVAKEVRSWEPRLALEPESKQRVRGMADRAAWCGEKILVGCAEAKVGFTALELSARVALALEKRWRKHPRVARVWREADLAGRKRFLLVAWQNA